MCASERRGPVRPPHASASAPLLLLTFPDSDLHSERAVATLHLEQGEAESVLGGISLSQL